MKREIDLKEISDGRLYSSGDMVKADCHDCQGCSACCRNMGDTVKLDPMDLWRLKKGTGKGFAELMEREIELGIADGMILPNLRMTSEGDACPFLNMQGRCSIHAYRPGLCRLFPLGRYYEEKGFKYFLQIHECAKKERGKVKIKKWLGIPDLKSYEDYIWNWHGFLNDCERVIDHLDDKNRNILTLYVLRRFFESPYLAEEEKEFYNEFSERLKEVYEKLEGLKEIS